MGSSSAQSSASNVSASSKASRGKVVYVNACRDCVQGRLMFCGCEAIKSGHCPKDTIITAGQAGLYKERKLTIRSRFRDCREKEASIPEASSVYPTVPERELSKSVQQMSKILQELKEENLKLDMPGVKASIPEASSVYPTVPERDLSKSVQQMSKILQESEEENLKLDMPGLLMRTSGLCPLDACHCSMCFCPTDHSFDPEESFDSA